MTALPPLPERFVETRDALHLLAAHVLAPARRAKTGRIGLRSTPGGFGTPMFGDDEQLRVEGTALIHQRGAGCESTGLTSLAAAAEFAGVTLTADPGIGSDPPPLGDIHAPLALEPAAADALAAWFGFSAPLLEQFRSELAASGQECSEVQLWPEHFDLACNVEGCNFGCSPGDGYLSEPYVYVGPWNTDGLSGGDFWNAAFGAVLSYKELGRVADQERTALAFLRKGARLAG
jgi:hypothetical protein